MEEATIDMEMLEDLPDDLKQKIIENYRKELGSYRERKNGQESRLAEMFDAEIARIENYLSTTAAPELSKPAITGNGETFSGFYPRENEFARLMVIYNRDYFRKGLPAHVPQFMALLFRYDVHPASMEMKEIVDERFPVPLLEDMLDQQ